MSLPEFSLCLYSFSLFYIVKYFYFMLNLLKYSRSYSYDFYLYYFR